MDQGLCVQGLDLDALLTREWLATNQIGGYASSTLPGLNTRKYHGLLVAAMSPPVRRMVLLSRVEETLWRQGQRFALDCNEYPGVIYPHGHRYLQEFSSSQHPKWIYEGDGWRLQKELRLIEAQNTVVLTYTLHSRGSVDLQLRPLLAMRPIHDLSYQWNGRLVVEDRNKHHHRIPPTVRTPEAFFAHDGKFTAAPNWYLNQIYRREQQRGYAGLEDLWTPGTVRFHLTGGKSVHFVCSADPIEIKKALKSLDQPQKPVPIDPAMRALRAAAEQFVTHSADGTIHCIGGYPWFAPSTREALIGFAGLFLVNGKLDQAKSFLLSLASLMKHGLLPSHFPENGAPPLSQGADISLWFANAIWQYARYSNDEAMVEKLLDVLLQIIEAYRRGTELRIGVSADGLLSSRAPGMATSWMDAKVGDWVITPRVGKPVELNALWYNAVKIAAELCKRYGRIDRAKLLNELAASIGKSFNDRFWNNSAGCCFDFIDDHGHDPSIRPNQLLAISLPFAVLDASRQGAVLAKVEQELLAPRGVRTLSPRDPSYHGRYEGNATARDRAHHNGCAFPWLLGHYVTAMLKVHGRNEATRAQGHSLLRPCIDYMLGEGHGQLSEMFDGDPPHSPNGAIASAVSVGEIFRCYAEDALEIEPLAKTQPVPAVAPVPAIGASITHPA